jgi:hypothetical protein
VRVTDQSVSFALDHLYCACCRLTVVVLVPVGLVGFSFGVRIILSCLKELACYQAIWERQQESRGMNGIEDSSQTKMASFWCSLISISNKDACVEFSHEPGGIVEDVILMGVSVSMNRTTWLLCHEIVGG